jgi:hypothetical protein
VIVAEAVKDPAETAVKIAPEPNAGVNFAPVPARYDEAGALSTVYVEIPFPAPNVATFILPNPDPIVNTSPAVYPDPEATIPELVVPDVVIVVFVPIRNVAPLPGVIEVTVTACVGVVDGVSKTLPFFTDDAHAGVPPVKTIDPVYCPAVSVAALSVAVVPVYGLVMLAGFPEETFLTIARPPIELIVITSPTEYAALVPPDDTEAKRMPPDTVVAMFVAVPVVEYPLPAYASDNPLD